MAGPSGSRPQPGECLAVQTTPRFDLIQNGTAVAFDIEGVTLSDEIGKNKQGTGRISFVNENLEVILDTFVYYPGRRDVRPPPKWLGLGVRYRDIKPHNGAKTIDEVREWAKQIFETADTIVGHDINADFNMLRCPISQGSFKVRDTQRLREYRQYATGNNGKPALKVLAREFLGKNLQAGEHSSVEDAQATMQLFLMRRDQFEVEFGPKPEPDPAAEQSSTDAAAAASSSTIPPNQGSAGDDDGPSPATRESIEEQDPISRW